MMRWSKFLSAFFAFLIWGVASVAAQSALRRYVDVNNGAYTNDGMSWSTAKNNLQEAINDLALYMSTNSIAEGGEIFVAEGTYYPSESTDEGSTLFASFKMKEGITVYGGFPAGGRETADGNYIEDPSLRPTRDNAEYGWQFKYETVLSGDLLPSNPAVFQWNESAQNFTTLFPSNVYHVVWFASNGFGADGAPVPLQRESVLDGFTIKHGYASDPTFTGVHYSRGGGVYLVDGGVVRNCIITENSATERGGGVYLHGGGLVESCYVHRNTSPGGTATTEGYGGGVALVDGGDVRYSMIVNNFAANGGGLALYNSGEASGILSDHLNMAAVSSVVSNNTASNEGGGIYMRNGGILNNMTVTANRCNGLGITLNGVQNGKSGGVYVENYACIINSLFWGSTVGTTGVVQYYHRPDADKTGDLTSLVLYSAFSDQAVTEWTYTYRASILSLERENVSTTSNTENYPVFINPPFDASFLAVSGVMGEAIDYDTRYSWQPASVSPVREYGRKISDISALSSYPLDRATTTVDICGEAYSICPSLGAYRISNAVITPYMSGDTVALFVDPEINRIDANGLGGSWDASLVYLNVALSHFRDNADAYAGKVKRIYVKEGNVSPLCAYTNTRYLSAGIQMVSGVELYGGYARALSGTDRSVRNPVKYRSIIDGKVGTDEYVYHCVIFREVSGAVLDGFHIVNGDATLTGTETALIKNGGGIVMAVDPVAGVTGDGSMTGNIIRNCLIENCVANKGAALYAQPYPGAKFDLKMSNCVINNNTSVDMASGEAAALCFDIPAEGNDEISVELDHQTIVKNVGYGVCATQPGKVSMVNSWVWSNASRAYDDCTRLTADSALTLKNVTATYSAFDAGAGYNDNGNFSTLTYNRNDATYPMCENPTRNIGHTVDAYNTYNGGYTNYMPSNMNPIINKASAGSTYSATDITTVTSRLTGGGPDIGAYQNDKLPLKGTVFYVRDYRTADGRVDLTRGGDGSSWATAINGNAIYDLTTSTMIADSTASSRYVGYYDAATCPYGEQSDASRPFWSANGQVGWVYRITNTRQERYVGGLQYAVEKTVQAARAANKCLEVWVAGGTYTDYKGFVIRDSVSVKGGFPNFGNPGDNERHPLIAEGIPLSEENSNYANRISDYETILQIQAEAPVTVEDAVRGIYRVGQIQNNMRKTVLYQPDVCLPTYAPLGGTYAHGSSFASNDENTYSNRYRNDYLHYTGNPVWDGFTIRHGFIAGLSANRDGGAGVRMFQGVTIRNCVIRNNAYFADIPSGALYDMYDRTGWTARASSEYSGNRVSQLLDGDRSTFWHSDYGTFSHDEAPFIVEIDMQEEKVLNAVYWVQRTVGNNNGKIQSYRIYVTSNRVENLNEVANLGEEYLAADVSNTSIYNVFVPIRLNRSMTGRYVYVYIRQGYGGYGSGSEFYAGKAYFDYDVTADGNKLGNSNPRSRGGGVYCDSGESHDGAIENCFIYHNVTTGYSDANDSYGGGMYMISGTGYNLLVSNNYAQNNGGGIFIEDATFYNNTVAYNGSRGTGGMHQYTASSGTAIAMNVFNTIFYGNSGYAINAADTKNMNPLRNCYVHTATAMPSGVTDKILSSNGNMQGTGLANPFERGSNALSENNYRLSGSSLCVNAGLNEPTDPNDASKRVSLPLTDVDFADRIQDCTIDIGAYEYNGAYSIAPAEESLVIGGTTYEKVYVYYVSYSGAEEGNASASSPDNAACWMKLQQVLDAAGRQKAQNPTVPCVVKVAGSSTPYAPRRTTVVPAENQMVEEDEDVRSYALIVPRGVEVWGGYDETFAEATRDIPGHRTTFKAEYVSAADTSLINTYHAVVFTDLLYDADGNLMRDSNDAYQRIPAEAGYAVLDGLFITGGNADGSLRENDNRGGGVLAESYAHIRNCIVRGNSASQEGGGVYLKPGAIVSGSLICDNSADTGAGLYVDSESESDSTYIITSTVVQNKASGEGGGIYFTGRNLNVNSTVFWGNTANYAKDVYGNYNGDENDTYPFTYVAVENLLIPGLNNRSVSADNASGVRFVENDSLYMIEETSILVGTGMPATEYMTWISGVQASTHDFSHEVRMPDENIDIGARALGYSVTPSDNVLLQRIFVTDGTVLHKDLRQLLSAQLSGSDTLYQVRGASFVYPMYELHDALRYIKHIRNKQEPLIDGQENRNLRFEIYLAGGTYTPREASDGTTVENARTSTFTVPEGVSIFGGFSGDELYCQEIDQVTHSVAGINFEGGSGTDYLNARERMDINGNSIIEPWEYVYQTYFSGKTNSEISVHGVYHVIYACADPDKVGTLPDLVYSPNSQVASGLPIIIDGVTITGGYAANLVSGDEAYLDNYYKGGAVCVDGTDNGGISEQRRYIPLTIRRSLIYGNSGILGGAIYNTGICSIFNSQISANEAVASTAGVGGEYAGSGGAIYVDGAVYSINSLYANNEAANKGGAIFNESLSRIWVVNCNLVRNKAAEYPCIYSLNKSSIGTESLNLSANLVFNTAFWGNESDAARYTINKWRTDGTLFTDPSVADAPDILHFCAYEEGWDKTPEIGENDRDEEAVGNIENFKNNNVQLTAENRSLYGPNFANPSTLAGVSGYQQAADWSLSRINPLVDAGWGWGAQEYNDATDSWLWTVPEQTGGLYFEIPHYVELGNITIYEPLFPGLDDLYMRSGDGRNISRVCLDPNRTIEESGQNTYIDIGVYEYQHSLLNTDADTLYVCAEEVSGNVNDGSSWSTATSNLQRAIERLLLNRNGKDKIIYMTEGEFAPIYTINKNGGFVVNTRYGSQGETVAGETKNVGSLRISGGYNDDNQLQPIPVESPIYRGENYKTVITTINSGVKSLFNIEDIANREGNEQDAVSNRTVIPMTIENLTFENPYGAAFRYETSSGVDDDNTVKLVLSGCEFRGSDGESVGLPVVKIAGRGGRTLIYNTLFHSNRGVPIDAVDTEIFNATIALNTGVPVLSDSIYGGEVQPRYPSKLYNSVLWRNGGKGIDQSASAGIVMPQLSSSPSAGNQIIQVDNIRYNAVQNLSATTLALDDAQYHNDNLSAQNDDVINGPNFFNPYDGVLASRDFDIGASANLLNKGDSISYRSALNLASDQSSGYDISLNSARVYDDNIDRGAYENNQLLYPILYVQPGKTLEGDGTTWENAFGQGRLQEAIDLCAVYAATRANVGENAVVFVKSGHTGESLILRNGVSVYGSVAASYTDTVTADGVNPAVTVEKVIADRPGLLASTTTRTRIEGVSYSSSDAFGGIVVLDGFEVEPAAESPAAVVSLSSQMVLRNNYVHGATVTGSNAPVIANHGGLLYNMLVADNRPAQGAPVVSNEGGTLVNLTVDAPVGSSSVVHSGSGQMFNTVATQGRVFEASLYTGDDLPLDGNPYNTYLSDELSYQLKELSMAIDRASATPAIPAVFAPYVNLATDRDIMGNARTFAGAVDYGCFETWNITEGYKATQAPAGGSVVYLHDGNLLLENLPTTFAPGYLLLKEGTSLYGNGNTVSLNYVAVERTFDAGWQLAAFPYALQRDSISRVHYDGTTYLPSSIEAATGDTVATYNGRARAESLSRYHEANSPYWEEQSALAANEGFGLCLAQAGTYRFTGRATGDEPLYVENNTDKTVSLVQYNLTEVESDGTPRFTHKENMGWNLFGLPYLVAAYDLVDMDLPHLLYGYDGLTYTTTESWQGGTAQLGGGYFTQTAVIGDGEKEELLFPQPQSTSLMSATNTGMDLSLRITGNGGSDEARLRTSDSPRDALSYELGRDGVKFMSMNRSVPQIYVTNPSTGTRFSLAAAVDETSSTPIGVYVADSGFYTIDLPRETMTDNYDVVLLTDVHTGQTTDLKESSYTFFAEGAEDADRRFSLSFRRKESAEIALQVYLHERTLYVKGLQGGERIYLYDTSGHCLLDAQSQGSQYTTTVGSSGVYIVDVVSPTSRRSCKVVSL